MLMNARPRYVSNGFETFIVTQQGEVLHQSLVEMKKEDINARDAPRPVATYQTDSWDQQLDDFNGSEKDSVSWRNNNLILRWLTWNSGSRLAMDTSKTLQV